MPEFILDHGTPEASKAFQALDTFTQGYIEGMFFTSTGTGDDGDMKDATFAELAPEALERIQADCADFQASFGEDLDEAYDNGRINGYDQQRAGVDFWLTRNRHGAGFWDRGLGEVGDALTKNAHPYGEVNMYRGDDGLIYLA